LQGSQGLGTRKDWNSRSLTAVPDRNRRGRVPFATSLRTSGMTATSYLPAAALGVTLVPKSLNWTVSKNATALTIIPSFVCMYQV